MLQDGINLKELTSNFHLDLLKSELESRKLKNSQYSMRGFAKFIGLEPSVLSAIFKRKRGIPAKSIETIAKQLKLPSIKYQQFIRSIEQEKMDLKELSKKEQKKSDLILDELAQYKVIAEWEHYAVLSLLETSDFNADHSWISTRLGVSKERIDTVISQLERCKLIKKVDHQDGYISLYTSLNTTEDILSRALQDSHQETLDLAKSKLSIIPVEKKDYTSATLAINSDNIPMAKKLIREFRAKLSTLLEEGTKDQVYQVSIQLFPLTSYTEDQNENS